MITRVLLVFHADGRLYFSTQAPEAFEDAGRWERMGFKTREVSVNLAPTWWQSFKGKMSLSWLRTYP